MTCYPKVRLFGPEPVDPKALQDRLDSLEAKLDQVLKLVEAQKPKK